MRKRTIVLLLLAAGVWAFVFFFYFRPGVFGHGRSNLTRSARSLPLQRTVVAKLPNLELKKATPVDLDLNFTPVELLRSRGFTKILSENAVTSNFPYRYVGYIQTEDGKRILLDSNNGIIEMRIGEKFGSYIIVYASELGLLVLDTERHRILIVK